MAARLWQRALTVVFVAVFLVTSCTSMESVSIPSADTPPALPAVKVGDTVVILTKDLKRKSFEVRAVEADALVGESERVAYADMATLSVKQFHKGATTVLVVLGVLLVWIIASAAELLDETEDSFDN